MKGTKGRHANPTRSEHVFVQEPLVRPTDGAGCGSHVVSEGEALKYDPEFRGPIKGRSCTDILCLLLFLVFLVGWGVVAGFAATSGDPSRLLYPTDSFGRVCGKDPGLEDKKFLFFFDLTKCASPKVIATGCPTPQVCVEKCPSKNWFYTSATADKKDLICKDTVNVTQMDADKLVNEGHCARYYVESDDLARRCIPKNISAVAEQIFDSFAETTHLNKLEKVEYLANAMKYVMRFGHLQEVYMAGRCIPKVPDGVIDMEGVPILDDENEPVTGELLAKASKFLARFYQASEVADGVFQDIKTTWWILLAGFGVAMVVSFIWILLLRFISAVMIWFSLVAFIGLSGFGAYYTLNKYLTLRNIDNSTMTKAEFEFTTELSKYAELETTWLILFIITVTIFLVCLLVLIFLRKRINIAIALIGQASKCVGDIMSPLLPVVPSSCTFSGFFWCGLLSSREAISHVPCQVCLLQCTENATCNFETFDNSSCPGAMCQFYDYYVDPNIPRLHIYNVFGLFWSMFFISAFGEMVLAGAFASWYWAFDKSKDVPSLPVTYSFGRTLRYHIGTLAFGSLIIAIVRMIRVILEYIDYKVKQQTDSKIVRCLLCCCRCCLWCLEKFLKFINRNAYVYCAIYGKNFCVSAKNAFSLIMRNIARVVVLDKVTDFLLFIGKMVVVGGVAVASFFIFSGEVAFFKDHIPTMNYYLTPVIIITIGTFFIASAFFSVYSMAVDTLFLSFLEDCERNDGSAEKPYFMSKDLMKILEKKNKFKEE
ncbi:choline transporter-like protein 2 [Penaeus monodon]|uniref:choline transporter-like protein 2 n=1 Tax=Penaeus monodon TaxID=6687 RepID=UPI0018A72DA0|nr:choline transporter-like protein 2 [Penaeus monodon]